MADNDKSAKKEELPRRPSGLPGDFYEVLGKTGDLDKAMGGKPKEN